MNVRCPSSPIPAPAVAAARRVVGRVAAALLATLLTAAAAHAAKVSAHPLEDPYRGGASAVAAPPSGVAAPAVAPAATPAATPAVAPAATPAVASPVTASPVTASPVKASPVTAPPAFAAPAFAATAAGARDAGTGVSPGTDAAPAPGDAARAYRIGLGDELNFRFVHVPELNTVATVRSDGTVSLPLLGEWRVAGATLRELTQRVQAALAGRVNRPDLVLNVQGSPPSQRVFIGGEVVKPGVQPLAGSLTVLQAVMGADGLKDTAEPREVAVLRVGADGAPRHLRVDLRALMAGEDGARDLVLAPHDVVVVPRSGIANVGLWVDQYIRRVIPISLGVGYSIGRGTATP